MTHIDLLSSRAAKAIVVCIAIVCVLVSESSQANDIQVGRYSLYTAKPTEAQSDLLATMLTVRLPDRIQTVGEAVKYLLHRSGYRLAAAEVMQPDTVELFTLPLPAAHRRLGPMTLRDALKTLTGPAFHLVQDPVHRLITFERCVQEPVMVREAQATSNFGSVDDGD